MAQIKNRNRRNFWKTNEKIIETNKHINIQTNKRRNQKKTCNKFQSTVRLHNVWYDVPCYSLLWINCLIPWWTVFKAATNRNHISFYDIALFLSFRADDSFHLFIRTFILSTFSFSFVYQIEILNRIINKRCVITSIKNISKVNSNPMSYFDISFNISKRVSDSGLMFTKEKIVTWNLTYTYVRTYIRGFR